MKFLDERLRRELQALEGRALRRRLAVHDETAFPQITFGRRRMLDFAANDYLGLAQHPRVSAALARGAERWGAGAGAAHLLGGHSRAHADFEEALADFLGREAALLFSTGYMANLGLISTLVGRGDTVIADRLDHASILDAATLSRARLLRYPHGDCAAAAARIGGARGRRLIVTDGVFSMDGDLAPLPTLAALAEDSDAVLAVDDAHGFGVLGAGGRGSLEHFGLDAQAVPALVVTLGKALGVFGAAVVGSRALIETLVNRARPWIYTTALPPALAEALCVALEVMREESWRRDRVAALVARFRASAAAAGLPLLASSTPIQPILVGDAARALGFSQALADRGYFVPAIRPPTVPAGAARLRISLTAAHSNSDLDGLVAALVGIFADA